jgi:hypothetical protein
MLAATRRASSSVSTLACIASVSARGCTRRRAPGRWHRARSIRPVSFDFPGRRQAAGHFRLRHCGVRLDRALLGVGESAPQRGACTQQAVTSRNLFLCRGGISNVCRIADTGPVFFRTNCLLEFRCLAVVFGDHSFGVRDVDQRPSGRPPVGIRMIGCNSLFDIFSVHSRARQVFLQDGDQAKGYARILVLRAKFLGSLRLQSDLALDLGDCGLRRFALCLPGVHTTPRVKLFRRPDRPYFGLVSDLTPQ